MWDKAIIHSDINHCYAQIEEMKHPEHQLVPMAVGGHEESRHGIILAKNDLAKTYGIKTGESLREAYEKCPDLLVIHPNYQDYHYYTEKVKDIYREYTDQVESFGLDEAWVDITHSQKLFGSAEHIALEIQKRVYNELGLTVSMGLSFNKVFAKIGSDMDKHLGLAIISEENFKYTIWNLPIEDMFYVGRATKTKMYALGIDTIGKLACYDVNILKAYLGKMGEILWEFANGLDDSYVTDIQYHRDVKSIGNSITTCRDVNTRDEVKNVLWVLAESVASRMRDIHMHGNIISIHYRTNEFNGLTRQRKIKRHINTASEIVETAMKLFDQNYRYEEDIPLRSIGVSVAGLTDKVQTVQLDLFSNEMDLQRELILEQTVDQLRNKYGHDKIKRCSVMVDGELTNFNPRQDHTIHPVGYF